MVAVDFSVGLYIPSFGHMTKKNISKFNEKFKQKKNKIFLSYTEMYLCTKCVNFLFDQETLYIIFPFFKNIY